MHSRGSGRRLGARGQGLSGCDFGLRVGRKRPKLVGIFHNSSKSPGRRRRVLLGVARIWLGVCPKPRLPEIGRNSLATSQHRPNRLTADLDFDRCESPTHKLFLLGPRRAEAQRCESGSTRNRPRLRHQTRAVSKYPPKQSPNGPSTCLGLPGPSLGLGALRGVCGRGSRLAAPTFPSACACVWTSMERQHTQGSREKVERGRVWSMANPKVALRQAPESLMYATSDIWRRGTDNHFGKSRHYGTIMRSQVESTTKAVVHGQRRQRRRKVTSYLVRVPASATKHVFADLALLHLWILVGAPTTKTLFASLYATARLSAPSPRNRNTDRAAAAAGPSEHRAKSGGITAQSWRNLLVSHQVWQRPGTRPARKRGPTSAELARSEPDQHQSRSPRDGRTTGPESAIPTITAPVPTNCRAESMRIWPGVRQIWPIADPDQSC